jgi:hypothetical protein
MLGRHCVFTGEKRNMNGFLVGGPEEKRLLGRNRHRWEDAIEIYRKEAGLGH